MKLAQGEVARPTASACLVLLALAGCVSRVPGEPVAGGLRGADRVLVIGYFDAVNAAADEGSAAQESLFTRTQHPDFRTEQCSLDGLTVTADPAYTTLRTDRDWHPPSGGDPPRGVTYAIAATITVALNDEVLGSQIGSLHVVVLDGTTYGFRPCPA